jgi:hypothetical protein
VFKTDGHFSFLQKMENKKAKQLLSGGLVPEGRRGIKGKGVGG